MLFTETIIQLKGAAEPISIPHVALFLPTYLPSAKPQSQSIIYGLHPLNWCFLVASRILKQAVGVSSDFLNVGKWMLPLELHSEQAPANELCRRRWKTENRRAVLSVCVCSWEVLPNNLYKLAGRKITRRSLWSSALFVVQQAVRIFYSNSAKNLCVTAARCQTRKEEILSTKKDGLWLT